MHFSLNDHERNQNCIHASLWIEISGFLQLLTFCFIENAFGFWISRIKKGYFPHFFNTDQNQHYVGPYPPASYYNPVDTTASVRKAFYQWYEQQKGKLFDFQKEFLDYCISDVDILQRCCAQFRNTIQSLVQVNPFQEVITVASTANLAYR